MNDLPYRRNYGRLLIAATVVATLMFPFVPKQPDDSIGVLRGILATFALGLASLWAPVLVYAGLRTNCTLDWVAGVFGMLTLLFWIPCLIYDW
jgi:hypothetical protein